MKRNANREGRVWQRADGRWTARVYGPEKGSKAHYVYGRTREDAKAAKKRLEEELAAGMPAQDQTVGQFFDFWLTKTLPQRLAAGRLAPSTLDSYGDNARKHILPDLGHIPLRQLSISRVSQWQDDLLRKPSSRPRRKLRKGEKSLPLPTPLSPRTVAYCHAILRRALNDAWRNSLISRNVAMQVEPPKLEGARHRELTKAEAGALMKASREDRLACYWRVMLALGFRRGEGLGLRWADIDFEAGTITLSATIQRQRGEPDPETGRRTGKLVAKGLKTTGSEATVPVGPGVLAALRQHQRDQAKARLKSKVWLDADLVFTTSLGTALEPRGVNRQWAKVCERAGVQGTRIHDLRHAYGSYLRDAGADMKVVQAGLRHTQMSTTADVYVHVFDEAQRAAAVVMDDIVTGLIEGAPRPARKLS